MNECVEKKNNPNSSSKIVYRKVTSTLWYVPNKRKDNNTHYVRFDVNNVIFCFMIILYKTAVVIYYYALILLHNAITMLIGWNK